MSRCIKNWGMLEATRTARSFIANALCAPHVQNERVFRWQAVSNHLGEPSVLTAFLTQSRKATEDQLEEHDGTLNGLWQRTLDERQNATYCLHSSACRKHWALRFAKWSKQGLRALWAHLRDIFLHAHVYSIPHTLVCDQQFQFALGAHTENGHQIMRSGYGCVSSSSYSPSCYANVRSNVLCTPRCQAKMHN